MMELLEAYELAMQEARDLEKTGIVVKFIPSCSRTIQSVLDKYAGKDGVLPVDKWFRVRFHYVGNEQLQAIQEAHKGLIWRGMNFDSGGMTVTPEQTVALIDSMAAALDLGRRLYDPRTSEIGFRDWELDWSFRVRDMPDADHENRVDMVEEVIGDLEKLDEQG
jgi:hypothetical protein